MCTTGMRSDHIRSVVRPDLAKPYAASQLLATIRSAVGQRWSNPIPWGWHPISRACDRAPTCKSLPVNNPTLPDVWHALCTYRPWVH